MELSPPKETLPHRDGDAVTSGPNDHALVLPVDQPLDVATGGGACDCEGPLQGRPLTTGLGADATGLTWRELRAAHCHSCPARRSPNVETLLMNVLCVLVEL